jgi:hypothetical protein
MPRSLVANQHRSICVLRLAPLMSFSIQLRQLTGLPSVGEQRHRLTMMPFEPAQV